MTSTDAPLPVLIYARISSDPENSETGVSRQLALQLELTAAAADEVLLDSVPGSPKNPKDPGGDRWPNGCLVDNDISGAELDGKVKDRPEFERLMTLISGGLVKVVRAQNQARLMRGRKATGRVIELGARRAVKLKFLKGSEIDLSDKMGRAMVEFMAIFDRMYVEQVQEAQQVATEYQAKAGAYHGGRPFGFERVAAEKGHGEDRSLTPYEPEAAVVREAARRVIDGESLYAICTDLDARGIRTATGKTWKEVGTGSLKEILLAWRNVGVRVHAAGSKRRRTPEAIQHKASWPPILDREVFDEVQEILLDPARKTSPGPARRFLLPGFLECGKCGTRMKSQTLHQPDGKGGWISRGPRYGCDSQRGGCGGVIRKMADVDRVVVQRVFHWLEDNGLFDAAMESAESEDVLALRKRRRELERQKEKFNDLLADEVWTRAEYDRQIRRKDAEVAEVDAEFRNCLGGRRMDDIPERGARFVSRWQEWEADGPRGLTRRRYVVETLIDRVVVHPVGKGRSSERLVQVFPAAWFCDRLGDRIAEVLPLPVPIAVTGPDQVREWLAARTGESFTRFAIAEALGFTANNCHKYLLKLEREGAISRAWGEVRTAEGRAAFTYTITDGQESVA